MDDLNFITDATLKKTIKDSIEYTYLLFEETKREGVSDLYIEETYRVIILYITSSIEAILLYFYNKHEEEMSIIEYKFVYALPEKYSHLREEGNPVVIAVQKKIPKPEYQLGLFELATFFRDLKLMTEETAKKILVLNNARNTLHFSKARHEVDCSLKQVEKGFGLLVHVIQRAPKKLLKT